MTTMNECINDEKYLYQNRARGVLMRLSLLNNWSEAHSSIIHRVLLTERRITTMNRTMIDFPFSTRDWRKTRIKECFDHASQESVNSLCYRYKWRISKRLSSLCDLLYQWMNELFFLSFFDRYWSIRLSIVKPAMNNEQMALSLLIGGDSFQHRSFRAKTLLGRSFHVGVSVSLPLAYPRETIWSILTTDLTRWKSIDT